MQRKNFRRKETHCLYRERGVPVEYIKPKLYKEIRDLLKIKKGMVTLDYREVRKLHGNNWLKKEYKKRRRQLKNNA